MLCCRQTGDIKQRSLVFHEGDKLTKIKETWHHVGNMGDEDATR